jgi:uncharacterized protein (DUF934 family)
VASCDVLRDQPAVTQRCGFDVFVLRDDPEAGGALAAYSELRASRLRRCGVVA